MAAGSSLELMVGRFDFVYLCEACSLRILFSEDDKMGMGLCGLGYIGRGNGVL